MENEANFLFHHSLNDFLKPDKKNKQVIFPFNGSPAIKDSIEAIGIPHTEVDVITVNDHPVDFYYKISNHDKVAVFPLVATIITANSLTPAYVYPLRFVVDVHAGKLAKALRMLGFDVIYDNNYSDYKIAEIAADDNRIVITRDIGLLKHNKIKWGHWLRFQHIDEQIIEVVRKYNLKNKIHPFERCIECNGKIESVRKEEIYELLPLNTREHFNEFYRCHECKKVYWKGSHHTNMLRKIDIITRKI